MTERTPQRFRFCVKGRWLWGVVYPSPFANRWTVMKFGGHSNTTVDRESQIANAIRRVVGDAEVEFVDHDYEWSGRDSNTGEMP